MSTLLADPAAHDVVRKVMRRLIPFCVLCYILNYIDRVNIGIANLNMVDAHSGIPGFTDQVYNNGAGIFFLGYFLFELPSNLIQQRVGPRRWIARIMISWGLISTAFVFTAGPWSFYSLRFLLGLAEAGFFPGVILYLSYWIPHAYRARAAALFLTSTAIAGIIGNPLGGTILYFAGQYPSGLRPWQWLFLIEGIPTVILGLVTLFFLTDKPADAHWLTPDERTRLSDLMARELAQHPAHHTSDLKHAFSSIHTWMLSLLYGLVIYSFYTVNFYTPKIIRNALQDAGAIILAPTGTTLPAATQPPFTPGYLVDLQVGLLSAIPFGAAAIGMVLIGRHSDRHDERRFHFIFACAMITLGLSLTAFAPRLAHGTLATVLTITGLSIGAVGAFGMFGPFWSLPTQFLTGTAVAAAFAIINSLGNLSGFVAPKCFNFLSMQNGLLTGAGLAVAAAILALLAPMRAVRSSSD